ncbi:unnamed protein product [Linum tenue]|uniref:Dynein light chain n=1 Tax=Linum tenue TaxID=586396 RepID=A0AAV0L225_9ROSI|nr:unnamed protein product [Linum tenue]
MPEEMQGRVLELPYQTHEVSDGHSIAHYIKQKFDEDCGGAWHCVVGKEFGFCIAHLCGTFIFFGVEMMEFLIFKDGNDFSLTKEEAAATARLQQKRATTDNRFV